MVGFTWGEPAMKPIRDRSRVVCILSLARCFSCPCYSVTCPACAKQMRASDDQARRKTKCPKCGTVVVIPGAVPDTRQAIQEMPIKRTVPPIAPRIVATPAPAFFPQVDTPTCSCPYCGRTGIPFKLEDANTAFGCPKCGGKFTPMGGAAEMVAQERESQDGAGLGIIYHAAQDSFPHIPPRHDADLTSSTHGRLGCGAAPAYGLVWGLAKVLSS